MGTLAFAIGATCCSIYFLNNIRYATGLSMQDDEEKEDDERPSDAQDIEQQQSAEEVEDVALPFIRVDMTFQNIHYYVKASTSDELLELLKGISGYFFSRENDGVDGKFWSR